MSIYNILYICYNKSDIYIYVISSMNVRYIIYLIYIVYIIYDIEMYYILYILYHI